ncbi:MAG: hypothetical protein U0556_01535 [Dehalococcoidia bacterium]
MIRRFFLLPLGLAAALAAFFASVAAIAQTSPAAPFLAKHPAPVLAETGYPLEVFDDEFNTPSLDPGWFFIRQDPQNWRTGPPEDSFRITVQHGDIYGDGSTARNITLRGAPDDFEMRTKLTFAPSLPTQQAGLIFYQNDYSYVKLVRIALPSQFPGQQNQRIQMLYQLDDETKAVAELNVPNTTVYLRMRRVGGRVDGWWSADGTAWHGVGTMLEVFVSQRNVGFFAVNGNDNTGVGPTATYDWFRLYNVTDLGYASFGVASPSVIKDGSTYKMWFTGQGDNPPATAQAIGYATSPDGINWTRPFTQPVFRGQSPPNRDRAVNDPTVLKDGATYKMWYFGFETIDSRVLGDVYYATSLDGITWTRQNRDREGNLLPVLSVGSPLSWDDLEVRPGRVLRDGANLVMYYTGRSLRGDVGIGRATSADGLVWTKSPGPLIAGVSAPRTVTNQSGVWSLLYQRGGSIFWSSSTDGLNWSAGTPVLSPGVPGAWDTGSIGEPWGMVDNGVLNVWYSGGPIRRIGLARSTGSALTRTFIPAAARGRAAGEP